MHYADRLLRTVILVGCLLGLAHLDVRAAWAVGESVNGFPNWAERVIHEWINRARVDPQLEMNACGSPCLERACYSVMPPLTWKEALNRAARFHSDEQVRQGYFAHSSACTVVPNINSIYPTSCNGSAACACVGGTKACNTTCTDTGARIQLFGSSWSGEIIASPSDPNQAFYLWLFETGNTSACQFTSANGHRMLILTSSGAVGLGVAGYSTGDFGPGSAPTKLPSGSHYPQQAASVAAWANWYDSAGGPSLASINVDGNCTAMTLGRGTQTNGAWTATLSGFGSGCHRYYFSFVDGAGTTVTYPTTGSLAIGSGAACPDWDSARPAACGSVATALPTASFTATRTASPTAPPTASRTSTPSPSPTRTPTFVLIPLPSTSPTASPSLTPTPTPTFAPTTTPSAVPTDTATAAATPTPSPTATPVSSDLSGFVSYDGNGLPVSQVTLHASGATTTLDAQSNTSGSYGLADVAPEDIVVTPAKTGDAGNGVSTLDASYVLQYVLGGRQLSAPQQMACDVTGNGALSALDASLILRYKVGLITQLPVAAACGSDWIFFPHPAAAGNQTLIQPQTGASTCRPGAIAYEPLAASAGQQNFSALLFGDCTGNWQPPGGGGGGTSASLATHHTVHAGALRPLRSGHVALPIFADTSVPAHALDVRLDYDAAALRLVSARPVGSARGAAMAMNDGEPGVGRIAIASGKSIETTGGPLLVVVFEVRSRRHVAAPSVSGRVDEN